jgi:hypothetical protein
MMKAHALLVMMALAAAPAFGQSRFEVLNSPDAHVLTKAEVERLVYGAKVSIGDDIGTRSWIHGGRSVIAMLEKPAAGASRPLRGKGLATVDPSGAYCVSIEWPRTEETWCRRIVHLHGAYYAVSDDAGDARAYTFEAIQPSRTRLGTLSRLWSLARISAGAAAP